MFTTPRKVKQESRLRRSLSLTNTSRLHNGKGGGNAPTNSYTSSTGNGDEYSSGEYYRHLHNIEESRDTNTYFQFNGDLNLQRSRYSYTPGETFDPVPDLVEIPTGDNSIVVHSTQHYSHQNSGHKPPPYRIPPAGEGLLGHQSEDSLIAVTSSDPHHQGVPDSPGLVSLQIHSSKFPIVKEVVISQQDSRGDGGSGVIYEPNNRREQQQQGQDTSRIPVPVLSPEYIKKFQNKKLTKKHIEWTDERKAFTLDSHTAKDIQQRLATYPITRANSADLEKAIKCFNEENSYLMSSMQQQQQYHQGGRHFDGIDNPALELGPHSGSNAHIHNNSNSVGPSSYSSGGNKMSSGYNYSDSSASQSLSLSSSNTDSLDTVIYKGPSQSTTSIRDWQRSMESNPEFSHRNDTNSYRDSSGLFDGRASYQPQQAPSYPQQMQFNGAGPNPTNTFAIEYRHSQQQNQVQQNLSVHSIPSSSTGNSNANNSAVGGNINTSGGSGFSNNMRSGNGTAYGSNPQLPTKSPMLNHKQFSTANGQHQSSSHLTADPMLVDKSKDSTKLFHTKTYNHIKDMISSRFGSGVSSNTKGLNNSVPVNGIVSSASSSNNVNNNGTGNGNNHSATNGSTNGQSGISVASNAANSYIDLTMGVPSYGHAHNPHPHHGTSNVPINGHGQNLPHSYNSNSNGILVNRAQQNGPPGPTYYQHQQNPSINNNSNTSTGMINGNSANSYKSPNMNDRKNVNTSFRKAIQQSTLKSNLTEDSLQLRPIMENSSQQNYNNRGMQYSTHSKSNPSLVQDQQKYGGETVVQVERAQRALDKLMEAGVPLQRTGSGPMLQTNPSVQNRVQQFSPSAGGYGDESQFSSRPSHQTVAHTQPSMQGGSNYPGNHDKIRYQHAPEFSNSGRPSYNVKQGPASSNSNSSSGIAMVESSLSSPGSYSASRMPEHNNEEINNHQQSHNNQWGHLHSQNPNELLVPPPLPKSQKPDTAQGSLNTIGLPLPSIVPEEMRENGDGSSATMESTSGNMLMESPTALCGKSKSDQLKQITTDLQNIALSVAAEQHMHNNNHSSSSECEKGSQRVGSGQSHTTTDSGLGTVMLTKSPLNSNSDPSERAPMTGTRPNADSVSSGNDSEWVDLVEPEIQQILEIERSSKSGKINPHVSSVSGLNPVGNTVISSHSTSGAITSTPTAVSKASLPQKGGNNNTNNNSGHNSTNLHSSNSKSQVGNSGNLGDITASPIPHPRQNKSPGPSPKLPKKFDLNAYSKKAGRSQSQELLAVPSTSQAAAAALAAASKVKSPRAPSKVARSNSGSGQRWSNRQQRLVDKNPKAVGQRSKEFSQTLKGAKLTRNAMNKLGQILYSLQDENGDMTSTTGLDFESVLDCHTEFTTDDDDLSTTIDTTDAHAIRRQLESLESMYTEVLKVLGEKKFSRNRMYPPNTAELRAAKRRPYGSMSSLPSSVSSRPFRERSRKIDEKKKVKDLKSINRRFQRLESHVVTLARSVAHLSSEMRTQHLMVQEMESIRNELSTLRNQVVKNSMQSQSAQAAAVAAQNFNRNASGRHGGIPCANQTDWTSFRNALPSLTNPCRVRKLTKFFGDEPPLIRIFLKKLGYEKYAIAFEQERIGIMELPYLTEDRLNKLGIPLGPRVRILHEAQICLKPGYHGQNDGHPSHHPNNHNTGNGNLSVYVV